MFDGDMGVASHARYAGGVAQHLFAVLHEQFYPEVRAVSFVGAANFLEVHKIVLIKGGLVDYVLNSLLALFNGAEMEPRHD